MPYANYWLLFQFYNIIKQWNIALGMILFIPVDEKKIPLFE